MGRKRITDHNKIIELYLELGNTKQVAEQLGIKQHQVCYALKLKGLLKNRSEAARKYIVNYNYFRSIDTEEKAYWLGFLMADGYIADNTKNSTKRLVLALQKKDLNHIDKFRRSIESTHPISTYTIGTGKFKGLQYSRLSIRSERLCQDLIAKGCTQRKSLTLRFPDKVKNHLISHFIRGYFDGDGSVFTCEEKHWRSKKVSTIIHVRIIGTEEFLNKVRDYLTLIINARPYMNRVKPNGINTFSIGIKRNVRVKAVYNYLYKNATVFLDRKKKKFEDYFKLI